MLLKKYYYFGGGKKKSDSEFLSYNLMFNSGIFVRMQLDLGNFPTIFYIEFRISNLEL
jgi:hypothetical protein